MLVLRLALSAFLVSSAVAAPIFVVFPVTGFQPLTATIVNTADVPPAFVTLDFRGLSGFALLSDTFSTLSAGAATDAGAPFPNSIITVETFDGVQQLSLNYSNITLFGSELFVTEVAAPNPIGGTITDPGLLALLQAPTIFDFTYATSVVDQPNNIAASYFTLNGIFSTAANTPEPVSAANAIEGLLFTAAIALHKRFGRRSA